MNFSSFKKCIDEENVLHFTLSGAVSQTASLVGPGGLGCPVDAMELTVLPAPQAKQEANDIALLFAVQFLHILVRTHFPKL